ncbi:cytochrome P450 [Flaviflexus salsibiostraticola]|uniref:Cytochrome P450 n=1 Tax=Flaviflexus salsibiostraticola TaxID=1282737 RepID=A0A3S8ZAW3_9ACTO|nr:cytochrome P450 [Flaviflexus salsibiostraticola]AZN30653.1 cytochrome P450 [Flaviflexus salsibiostraticola]
MTDARTLGDRSLARCPVSHDSGSWTVWGNEEARRVAEDPATFSSRVSRHLSVPNGMDGDEHRRFRAVIDRHLSDDAIRPLYPEFERIALDVDATMGDSFDANVFGSLVAVRCQSSWLGWDESYEDELLAWISENQAATRSGVYARTAAVAEQFESIVRRIVADTPGAATAALMADTVEEDGAQRPLTPAEIVSILRNWTAGDLGSITYSIGIVAHFLATHHAIAGDLRRSDEEGGTRALDMALDEILRIDDPFLTNRRRTTADVTLAGQDIPADSLVHIHWTAANRDPRAFGDPDAYDPVGNAPRNLVYGAGPHVCPGRTLSTLELRAALVALLRGGDLTLNGVAAREEAPAGGYSSVPVRRVPRRP